MQIFHGLAMRLGEGIVEKSIDDRRFPHRTLAEDHDAKPKHIYILTPMFKLGGKTHFVPIGPPRFHTSILLEIENQNWKKLSLPKMLL